MDEVTIRRAVMADLEAVGALLQDVDDLHRGALPWLLRRVDGPPLTDFLEAYVSKHDHAIVPFGLRSASKRCHVASF